MKVISIITLTCLVIGWGVAINWWLTPDPELQFKKRIAIKIHKAGAAAGAPLDLSGTFEAFAGKPSEIMTAEWRMFRGPTHNNISPDTTPLADAWPKEGPPVVWSFDLGEGYAGPAVINGRFYVLDYLETEAMDSLRCFSMDDGAEIWRRSYKVKVKRNHGISRTVPATDGTSVVSLGPKCHVLCVDAANGDFKWGIDLVETYGTKVPLWYAGQCPVIRQGNAILAPGGPQSLMIAVDCQTGRVVWEVANTKGWKMSHSSIVPMTLLGTPMYVCFYQGGAAGVSLDGTLLWETDLWSYTVIAPSPVQTGDDRFVITSGYGAGSLEMILEDSGGRLTVTAGRRWKKNEFACEQQTPILYNQHLYTVMPNDGAEMRKRLVCMGLDGTMKWASRDGNRFGLGPFLIADNKIFVLSDDGVLTMAKADATGYSELARADVLDGHDAWGPMALINGRLILRDLKRMICLDLRKERK